MTRAAEDLQAVLTAVVGRQLAAGDWQIVAVAPATLLGWRLRAEIDKTFGALRDPVLIVIERAAAARDEEA
jgi:hypothetical protein